MISLELNIANELGLSALENLCLFLTKSSQSIALYFMAVFIFLLNHTNINYSRIRQVKSGAINNNTDLPTDVIKNQY